MATLQLASFCVNSADKRYQ